jgi:transcriptional regulator with XRE-family HTH domain
MPKGKKRYRSNLLLYRLRLKFSQKEVVALLEERSVQLLSRYESGLCRPNLGAAVKLAAIYCVPMDFLFQQELAKAQKRIRILKGRCKSTALKKEGSCRKY